MTDFDLLRGPDPRGFSPSGRHIGMRLYKGGGDGSSQENYKNLERLYGIQSDSAQLLYDQANKYLPGVTSSYLGEVNEVLNPAYAEKKASRAASDMVSANAMERAATERELTSMGVNPNDPRFASSLRTTETNNAARMAAGKNMARDKANDMQRAVAQDAVGTFTGQSNSAASQLSNATSGMANLYNTKTQQQANQDAQQGAAVSNAIGAGLMAYSMFKDGGRVCKSRFNTGGRVFRKTIAMADGGRVQETGDELMARMAAKYGLAKPAPAAGDTQKQETPPPATAEKPAEKRSVFDLIRNRGRDIDKAAGYADGGQVHGLEMHSGFLGSGQVGGQGGFMPAPNMAPPPARVTLQTPQSNPMMSGLQGAMRMRQLGKAAQSGNGPFGARFTDAVGKAVGKFDAAAGNEIQSHAAGMRMSADQSQAAAEAYKAAAANTTDPAAAKAYTDAAANIQAGAGIQEAAPVVEQSLGSAATDAAGTAAADAAGTAAADAAGTAVGAAAADAAATGVAGAATEAAASTALGAGIGAVGAALPWVGAAYGVGSLLGMWADGGEVAQDYRDGAAVEGPGSHTDDIVPALLSNDEHVMNGEASALIGHDALEEINREGLKLRKQGVPLSKIKTRFGIVREARA